jgi:methylmalonyl-CoA/ethylmalonyl-CoA epimerase
MTKPTIDHIGIIVADLDAAVDRLRPVFGDAVTVKDLDDVGLRVAEFETANLTVELLQYTGPAEFAREVMGDRLGINHVSARVDDVDSTAAALADKGFALMDGFPRPGAHGRVAFFHPDDTTGLLFEICQPDEDHD